MKSSTLLLLGLAVICQVLGDKLDDFLDELDDDSIETALLAKINKFLPRHNFIGSQSKSLFGDDSDEDFEDALSRLLPDKDDDDIVFFTGGNRQKSTFDNFNFNIPENTGVALNTLDLNIPLQNAPVQKIGVPLIDVSKIDFNIPTQNRPTAPVQQNRLPTPTQSRQAPVQRRPTASPVQRRPTASPVQQTRQQAPVQNRQQAPVQNRQQATVQSRRPASVQNTRIGVPLPPVETSPVQPQNNIRAPAPRRQQQTRTQGFGIIPQNEVSVEQFQNIAPKKEDVFLQEDPLNAPPSLAIDPSNDYFDDFSDNSIDGQGRQLDSFEDSGFNAPNPFDLLDGDYPRYSLVPRTSFSCGAQELGGYYADIEADCQVFHICLDQGLMGSFLCPNGTLFNQQYFVCDWWFNVDCSAAPQSFGLNARIGVIPDSSDEIFEYDN